MSSPSLAEWKAVYGAAQKFKSIKPWTWMSDSDLFGVRCPESDEVGYCCVLGELGEVFGLAVYRGPEGLAGYLKMQSGEIEEDAPDLLTLQRCLLASFEDRASLDRRDLATIRKLGLRFKGRNAWPRFRSNLPGYAPWYLSKEEARFLTLSLEQAAIVALRFQNEENLLASSPGGLILVRVAEKRGGSVIWKDAWMEAQPAAEEKVPVVPVDSNRLAKVRTRVTRQEGTWELDCFSYPAAVAEGTRPYYPICLLIVDRLKGLVLHHWLASPWEFFAGLQEVLLDFFESIKVLPEILQVNRDTNRQLLAPIASFLGIELQVVRTLEGVEEFKYHLFAHLRL